MRHNIDIMVNGRSISVPAEVKVPLTVDIPVETKTETKAEDKTFTRRK